MRGTQAWRSALAVRLCYTSCFMRANQILLFSLLLAADSMHYIFARALLPRIQPTASAMYVLAIAAFEVTLFAALTRRLHWRAFRPHLLFYLAIGFLVAASTALSYESIAYVDPGTAALLGKTSTLFALFFGILWLHERLTVRQAAGSLVALLGAVVIVFQPGDFLRFGALLVLLSSLTYALHTALVKRYGEEINFLDFFVFRLLSTAGFLLLMMGGRGIRVWPDGMTWVLLTVTATIDVVLSRTLYYQTLRQLPMTVHSIILTLSPAVSILLAFLFFGVRPTMQQVIGGVAVLLGVLLVTSRGRRAPTGAPAPAPLPPAAGDAPEESARLETVPLAAGGPTHKSC
ncbi:MAG: DMT family transporter [Caldilineaceae bacterium]